MLSVCQWVELEVLPSLSITVMIRDQFSVGDRILRQGTVLANFSGISSCPQNFAEFDDFIFQLSPRFTKISDKTVDLLKSTDYFSNQQNSTATQKYSTDDY